MQVATGTKGEMGGSAGKGNKTVWGAGQRMETSMWHNSALIEGSRKQGVGKAECNISH